MGEPMGEYGREEGRLRGRLRECFRGGSGDILLRVSRAAGADVRPVCARETSQQRSQKSNGATEVEPGAGGLFADIGGRACAWRACIR